MQAIDLPLARSLRTTVAALFLSGAGLVLLSAIQWLWQLAWLVCWLVGGIVIWRHYLRARPTRLLLSSDGGLSYLSAAGEQIRVTRCQYGVVRPWLVSVRLVGFEGQTGDLFVPGGSLHPEVHWAMRRALIAFRPPDSEL